MYSYVSNFIDLHWLCFPPKPRLGLEPLSISFDLNGSKCLCPLLVPVEAETFLAEGGATGCPVTQGGSDSRRMSWGRDQADENGSRLVVREGQWKAHQCAWAVCGSHSALCLSCKGSSGQKTRQKWSLTTTKAAPGQRSFFGWPRILWLGQFAVCSQRIFLENGIRWQTFLAQTPWEAKLSSIGWPDLGPLRRGKGALCFWGVSPLSPVALMAPVLIQPSRPGCSWQNDWPQTQFSPFWLCRPIYTAVRSKAPK